MRSRAFRRFHRARMVARARKVQIRWWFGWPQEEQELHEAACKLADNLAICSCHRCGNPRRHFPDEALTVQERRADQDFRDQLADLD